MRRSWMIGLVAGVVIGVGTLLAGTLAALIGLVAIVAAVRLPRREATAGGLLFGLGGSWTLLLIRADLACGVDCGSPDLAGWYALGSILVVIGAILTARAISTARAR